MSSAAALPASGLFLKTFGTPGLIAVDVQRTPPLRRKDLALLIYLTVEFDRQHSRAALASLLWGDFQEEKARHSLTQSLRRLRLAFGRDAVSIAEQNVEWRCELPCDAVQLERAGARATLVDPQLSGYTGDFLADFQLNGGASGFDLWSSEKRVHFRRLAVRVLETQGEEAELRAAWPDALQLGLRVVEIEPIFEEGHRRVMRAWSALGERNLALKHYHDFARWLHTEIEVEPDPTTQALALTLRQPGTR